jgi:hypothetical protein
MKKAIFALVIAALVVAPPMASRLLAQTSVNQMKLAVDVDFLQRLQYNLVTQARVVLSETGIGSTHAKRAAYAANVINSPENFARVAAVMIVGGVNLTSTVTVDGTGKATSSVTDAALLSQIATYWNALAGIDSGS